MRACIITVLLLCGGCNCFTPVSELDGGGGTGGGGSGGECSSSSQCNGPRTRTQLCTFPMDAGFSCIDRTCVHDCRPDRTCDTAFDAGCLTCSGNRACESGPLGCGITMVAEAESDNGCPGDLSNAMLTLTPISGRCGWTVTGADGGTLGTVYQLGSGEFVSHFPSLGGTCTGYSGQTQVERWLLSCPACQVWLRF